MSLRDRCIKLFLAFFKIGLFTFGGGYAMISMIEEEIGRKRGWISDEELAEVFAIAESTPGPIAINSATYVGCHQAGAAGSFFATLGVVTPSFIIIYIISLFIEQFMRLTIISNAFKGIQVAVAALILRAGVRMVKKLPKSGLSVALCALAAGAILGINLLGWRFSTIWLILFGATVGLLSMKARGGKRQ